MSLSQFTRCEPNSATGSRPLIRSATSDKKSINIIAEEWQIAMFRWPYLFRELASYRDLDDPFRYKDSETCFAIEDDYRYLSVKWKSDERKFYALTELCIFSNLFLDS